MAVWLNFIFLGHSEPLALGTAPPAPSSSLLLHRTSSTPVCSMEKWINIWIWLCVFKFLLFRYKSSFNISLKFYDWKNTWFLANVYKLETQVSETYHKLSFLKSFHKTLRSHVTDKQDWVISCVRGWENKNQVSWFPWVCRWRMISLPHMCVHSWIPARGIWGWGKESMWRNVS